MKLTAARFLVLPFSLFLAFHGSSCANRSAQRESIRAVPLADTDEAAYGGKASVDPDFERIRYNRKIDPSLTRMPTGPYRVGPGDVLDIEVAERAETRAETRVMPDGVLYYDVAPGINVKGKTIREISNALAEALDGDYVQPVVSVNVAEAGSQRFWILGQVREPGVFPLRKPTTLIDAISQSGGMLTSQAGFEVQDQDVVDLERAILIRDSGLVPVDFEALVENGDMSQNVYIRPGDYIYLPSVQPRSVYVLGSVRTPGPVLYESGATMLTALAAAGGPRAEAIVTKALVIRGGTRDPEVAVVDVRGLMRGRSPDVRLEGGDIVWVPRSPWTNLRNYVEAVLVTAGQAIAVQEGLGVLAATGDAGVTITAGGQ